MVQLIIIKLLHRSEDSKFVSNEIQEIGESHTGIGIQVKPETRNPISQPRSLLSFLLNMSIPFGLEYH